MNNKQHVIQLFQKQTTNFISKYLIILRNAMVNFAYFKRATKRSGKITTVKCISERIEE